MRNRTPIRPFANLAEARRACQAGWRGKAVRPSRDLLVAAHQQITRDWWESRRSEFDLYVSELALKEVRAGDATLASQRLELLRGISILTSSSEILELTEDLIAKGPIPRKAAIDAAHIA